jgi:hypothetical protein
MRLDYVPNQSQLKCVHELDCDLLPYIQQEVMDWIEAKTDFKSNTTDRGFWKQIDYRDLAKYTPSLMRFFKLINIPIRQITVGLLTESMRQRGFNLHMGAPPYNFKINFPIYNTEDVWTEWYDIPRNDLENLQTRKNQHTDSEQIDLSVLHDTVQDLYPCLLRYNMHKNPIIFNSYIPHRVMPGPNAKYPRIMLATMPIIDPVDLMKRIA